jgi:hypothetical protein
MCCEWYDPGSFGASGVATSRSPIAARSPEADGGMDAIFLPAGGKPDTNTAVGPASSASPRGSGVTGLFSRLSPGFLNDGAGAGDSFALASSTGGSGLLCAAALRATSGCAGSVGAGDAFLPLGCTAGAAAAVWGSSCVADCWAGGDCARSDADDTISLMAGTMDDEGAGNAAAGHQQGRRRARRCSPHRQSASLRGGRHSLGAMECRSRCSGPTRPS